MTMLMTPLFALWCGLTVVFVGLVIYRSTLRLHEAGHIFLDDAEIHLAREQEQSNQRINSLQPWVRTFGLASGTLVVFLIAVKVIQAVTPL